MIFRLSLNSAFASAAVAAAALVATATSDSDVSITDSPPTSKLRSKINDSYVPFKIADSKGVGFDGVGFDGVGKDGIELSLRLENSSKKITRTRQLRIRNSSATPMDNSSPTTPFDHSMDIGVLDRGRAPSDTNANPDDTNNDRELTNSYSNIQDYCNIICGSDRHVIPYGTDMQSLVECATSDSCGDCSGDEDNIDYRCPSQIKCWDTSEITNMNKAFYWGDTNEPLKCWDVSSVTDMTRMFYYAFEFNQDVDNWDVSSVKYMDYMFGYAENFNLPLNSWSTSSVYTMDGMFEFAPSFNQPINKWDVSSTRRMSYMFFGATSFNQFLQSWDVSIVGDMTSMFHRADAFNQSLDLWNVTHVMHLNSMFERAYSFNQCLSSWADKTIVDEITDHRTGDKVPIGLDMFKQSGCTVTTDPDPANGPWCQDSSDQCFEVTCDDPECSGMVCADDPGFQLNGVKSKNCEWVAKQHTAERCMKPGVVTACRRTCDPNPLCSAAGVDCTNDQDFRLNGIKAKTCEWVAKQKTNERCKKPGVMNACRQICNPSCGCTDTTEEFEFQGGMITCEDLDINYCDAELVSSGDEFLEQLQNMIDGALEEALAPIHEKLDVVNQRLDAIEDADVVEEEISSDLVLDRKTYGDLCSNKCKKCID